MILSDYVSRLRATKTYESGLIRDEEYKVEYTFFRGPRTTVLPRADKEKHIIIMEFFGSEPILSSVLTDQNPEMENPKKLASNKMLFIYIDMKPQTLKIDTPNGGYRLEDGNHIDAFINISYRITDAEEFWMQGNDPLARLEEEIIDQAMNYFLCKRSEQLIAIPAELKKMLEEKYFEYEDIKDTKDDLKDTKDDFEQKIRKQCYVKGIEIITVYVNIKLNEALDRHLKKRSENIYGDTGVIATIYKEEEKYLKEKIIDDFF